jgi:hypothetical protein
LERVPPRLTYVFEIEGFVRDFVLSAVNGEGNGVDGDLDARRPVCVHESVLVMETL